jgi:hypothetical protein
MTDDPKVKLYIATAETVEADHIANGTVHVYGPDDTHTEANVWWGQGPLELEPGVWISACGNWRIIYGDGYGDGTSRNLCYCPFCKSLRARRQ